MKVVHGFEAVNHVTLKKGKIILDFPDGPKTFTKVLKCGEGVQETVSARVLQHEKDWIVMTLKIEGGHKPRNMNGI